MFKIKTFIAALMTAVVMAGNVMQSKLRQRLRWHIFIHMIN